MKHDMTRRNFMAATAASATVAAALAPSGATAAPAAKPTLKKGSVILFQGDSITDVGRDRRHQGHANHATGLGRGYPFLLAGDLLADHAALGLKIYNRGVSGHKVPQLDARWKADCLDVKPDVLSILIGVNDIWHKMNGKYKGTVEDYKNQLAALLAKSKEGLPNCTIVVCEPFVMRCGAVKDSWFPEFEHRRQAAEDVTKAAGAIWVPFQQTFNAAIKAGTTPNYWAGDGVHPSMAGHGLMAKVWRETVGL